MIHAIGIDVGGTNLKSIAVAPDGGLLGQGSQPTPRRRRELVERVRDEVSRLTELAGGAPRWLGISAPGLAAPHGRFIAWMQGRMEVLEELDWTEVLGFEPQVWVLNDGHAATLAETWVGAAAGCRDVLVLTLGTGVGGGILSGGRLVTGHLGRAGHVGHLCLDPHGSPDICATPGSLEDAVGEVTLGRRSNGRFSTTRELVEALGEGDAQARGLWSAMVRALACGLTSLINVVDPEVVVLGGGIARAGSRLFEPLARQLDELEWRPSGRGVPILPAALGDLAGAMGAARFAMMQDGTS